MRGFIAQTLRDLEQEYNAAVANGLHGKSRHILRRIQAYERDVRAAAQGR